MLTKIAVALAATVMSLVGFSASSANAADLGGKVTYKNVVTEQHCYRTVVTTYRLYLGKYWAPVHKSTTYHISQCGSFGGYLGGRFH